MNWKIEVVGIVEWFVPAIIAYQAIHHPTNKVNKESYLDSSIIISNDSKKPCSSEWIKKNINNTEIGFWLNRSKNNSNNFFDITNLKGKDISKEIDIFTYSFPCQDISNQGKQKGFAKDDNSRSGLLWEVDRILNEISELKSKHSLPKYLLLENVKAIINKNHIANYEIWIKRLEKLGYESKQYILNSGNFKSCQNRERVFVLSVLKKHKKEVSFEFTNLEDIKEKHLPLNKIIKDDGKYLNKFNQYKLLEKQNNYNNIKKYELLSYTNFQSENFVYDINYSGPTLTASGAMSRLKIYFGNKKIREMYPSECFEYMGFTKNDFNNVSKTGLITDNKKIYLCGNSISVQVLEAIFKSLKF